MYFLSDERAQLHMVEAILSIALLSLLLFVFYLNAYPSAIYETEISQEQVYSYLVASDDAGFLRPAIYNPNAYNLGKFDDFLQTIISADIHYRVFVDSTTLPIGDHQSSVLAQVSVSYWVSGYLSENQYNNDHIVILEVWHQPEE